MYESFYGFREKPFSLLPDPSFFYMSSRHRAALGLLEYGIFNRSGFIVITGEIGTGKSLLLRKIMSEARQDLSIGLISNTHSNLGSLIPWILLVFGLNARSDDPVEGFREFSQFLKREEHLRRRVVVVVDEAQNLTPAMLEELRLLSNINGAKEQTLQVVLSGQPGLRDLLHRSDLIQFAQRVDGEYHLEPMNEDETDQYIRHRIKTAGRQLPLFEDAASSLIYRLTGGVPRLVNQLCERSLVYGFAEQAAEVSARLVAQAASDRIDGRILPFAGNVDLAGFLDQPGPRPSNGNHSGPHRPASPPKAIPEEISDFRKGNELRASGRYDEAIRSFEKGAAHPGFWMKSHCLAGFCHREAGRVAEAIRSFKLALADHSASDWEAIAVRYELGRTLEDQGEHPQALECYRRVQWVEPGFRDVSERVRRLSASCPSGSSWIRRVRSLLKHWMEKRLGRSKGVNSDLIGS